MNVNKIIQTLKKKYPGKKIIKNIDQSSSEIMCEIEPSSEHPDYSVAIAIIDKSKPHYHKKTKEVYKIIKGKLKIIKNKKVYNLKEGDGLEVNVGDIHSAIGNETWVEVTSNPGWNFKDHILVGV